MAELNRNVTLLACQIDVPAMTTAAERDAHTDRVAAANDAELTPGGLVDLVVLPELGTLDYAHSCFDRIDEMAEPLDDSPTIDRLRADPGLAGSAVYEGMRFAPLPWMIPHRATRDMIYRDTAFAEGDLAFNMVPAANRDSSATERPDEFIIDRVPARHFAFGAGMHSCPGAHLAKIEMSMALLRLLE